MQEMVDDWYFFVWNFNKNKYDQTKWYSPTNKLLNILELDGIWETDEYYKMLDKPLKLKNGQFDQSNGGFDQSNGSGDRPIHNIEEDIEKYIESSNTNFPDGKIWNPDISVFDLVNNKLSDWITSLKNNKKGAAAPKIKNQEKSYWQNDYNILNAQSLIWALKEVWINNIQVEYILNNRRLLQALWEIKWDVEIIREAVWGMSDAEDLSGNLVNEIFRLNNNK